MKLYYSTGACSLAPHIALTESGLPYLTEPVNLMTGHYKGGEFATVNPKGYVPVLELDNGERLTEAAVILQYVADQVPEKNLIPRHGTMERYRCQEWLNFIATEVHKGFGPLWDEAMPDAAKEIAKTTLGTRFDFISQHLKTHSYLMGEHYTVADSYLFTILNWTHFLKVDLSKWGPITDYIGRVKSRPATMETLKSEGLIKKAS